MAGIYIHVPFCKQACIYCDFYFTTQKKHIESFIQALIHEISLKQSFIHEPIESIYWGGGTPSILPEKYIQQIHNHIYGMFDCTDVQEITLEANPDDMSPQKLQAWKNIGINRLSIGIQSFRSQDLEVMHRAHTTEQAMNCISWAKEAGFEHLSCDLMFGLPDMRLSDFQENTYQLLQFSPQHISAYSLTIEPRTALYKKVHLGKIIPPTDHWVREQFLWLDNYLTSQGYTHYEISNYAQAGEIALHNSSYWSGKTYLGLGPSAHSFDGKKNRYINKPNLNTWLTSLLAHQLPEIETEVLTEENLWNEQMMTHFRTTQGISLKNLQKHPEWQSLEKKIILWEKEGLIKLMPDKIQATPLGWIVSDSILTYLFV